MKNTPLQKLILKLADKQDEHSFNTEYDDGVRRGLALAIVNARELLEEEKQMVIDSWIDGEGRFFDAGTEIIEAEKYFNETYQNKEDE